MIRIAALSGSLRAASTNTILLHAAARLAPEGVEITRYGGLGDLPLFNPDDEDCAPPSVIEYRTFLKAADGVLVASPEYAHGVTGTIKNALDWVVGSGELVDKPVALLNASSRATVAHSALAETIRVMKCSFIPEASLTVPTDGRRFDSDGVVADPELSNLLRQALAALVRAIDAARDRL